MRMLGIEHSFGKKLTAVGKIHEHTIACADIDEVQYNP